MRGPLSLVLTLSLPSLSRSVDSQHSQIALPTHHKSLVYDQISSHSSSLATPH
ncbi:hypothetical protein BDQ12DRAFT_688050 [Crucibulum laeve]|uniref:Uncharacterized protein n=1 Tax=Crucibulum laeve TaxID=68775 RepID=A0A5C3LRA2_9AGAR|nr:hypothetical protein BDQ12DRAFT_688050 [Crucibulum laeve]